MSQIQRHEDGLVWRLLLPFHSSIRDESFCHCQSSGLSQTMDGSVAERNVSTIALEKLQGTMLSQSCGTKNASKTKSNEAIPMCLV